MPTHELHYGFQRDTRWSRKEAHRRREVEERTRRARQLEREYDQRKARHK